MAYERSTLRVVTVGLNPSDREFRANDQAPFSTNFRFPDYCGTSESLARALNNYFNYNPYDAWFKASFAAVLESFAASFYPGAKNTAIHTDICSPWATSPTWSKLPNEVKTELEHEGLQLWHTLMEELEPHVILFSASPGHEKKMKFDSPDPSWKRVDVGAKRPLLVRRFQIAGGSAQVLFQVQGRKPFLQTSKEEKLKFSDHLL
jgi:hypothetical protein